MTLGDLLAFLLIIGILIMLAIFFGMLIYYVYYLGGFNANKVWTWEEIRTNTIKKEIAMREDLLKRTDDPKIKEALKKTLEENYKELEELDPDIIGFEFIMPEENMRK